MEDDIEALRAEVWHLRKAIETRDVIGQAKGILMERHGIDSDAAFTRLVDMSQASNTKLYDVAAMLVDLRTDPIENILDND